MLLPDEDESELDELPEDPVETLLLVVAYESMAVPCSPLCACMTSPRLFTTANMRIDQVLGLFMTCIQLTANDWRSTGIQHGHGTEGSMSDRLSLGYRCALDVGQAASADKPELWADFNGREAARSQRCALLEASGGGRILQVELTARSSVPVCSFDPEEGENPNKDRGRHELHLERLYVCVRWALLGVGACVRKTSFL